MDMAPRKAFGGTVGVSSNFCTSLDSNQGRTAARSKATVCTTLEATTHNIVGRKYRLKE